MTLIERASAGVDAAITDRQIQTKQIDRVARDGWQVSLARAALLAVTVLAWEVISRCFADPFWIGRPSEIAQRLWQLAVTDELLRHAVPTVSQAAAGLALSIVVGMPIGLLFAYNSFIERLLEPFFLGLYSIPRIALAPLFILWFGIGPASKIVMAFSLVVFVVILNTYEGVRGVDRELIDMLRSMRASQLYILRKVLLPSIVTWLFASIRVGVGLALIGAVVGELLGANRGLGWYVENSASRIDVTGVFAGLVILMAVGMLLNELVKLVEHRVMKSRY